jgi:hypothetical protein
MVTDNDIEIRDKYKLPYSLYLVVLYLQDTTTTMLPQRDISPILVDEPAHRKLLVSLRDYRVRLSYINLNTVGSTTVS